MEIVVRARINEPWKRSVTVSIVSTPLFIGATVFYTCRHILTYLPDSSYVKDTRIQQIHTSRLLMHVLIRRRK